MKTSIIIVNFNTLDLLKSCVSSVKKHTKDYELIIIDNGNNHDPTDRFIRKVADKYVLNGINLGFAKANNQGAKIAEGELICFLNSDTIVTKGWLKEMIKLMDNNPKCAMVGPLGNPRYKELQGTVYQYQQYEGQYKVDTRVDFLSGYCLLIKKEIFEAIWFDEEFKLGLFEDNLLCEKIRMFGFELWVCAKSLVRHLGSESFRVNNINYIDLLEQNKKVYEKKLMELKWK